LQHGGKVTIDVGDDEKISLVFDTEVAPPPAAPAPATPVA
jgi:hypothetical protein